MVTRLDDGQVHFALYHPEAFMVNLAGDFNDWRGGNLPLEKDHRGWWHLSLHLPPGEHRFNYVVNGTEWIADYAAFGVERSEDEDRWQSVLWLEDDRPALAAAA